MKYNDRDIWREWVECDCHTEGIMVSKEFDDEDIPYIYLGLFTNNYCNNMGMIDKIKFLFNKNWISGEVCLTPKNAKKLSDILLRFVNKEKDKIK